MSSTALDRSNQRRVVPFRHYWRAHSRHIGSTLVTAAKEFASGDPLSHAATIAYYTIFSLPAVLIITVMIAATFYDEASVRAALLGQASKLIGPSTAVSLSEVLQNARVTETRFVVKVVGIAALIISAGSVFGSLQTTLNRIWQVEAKPGRAILKYLMTRLLSLAMVASFGFLMLVSLALDAALVAFGERLSIWLSEVTVLMIATVNVLFSFGLITFIFAMIFRMLPDARIKWGDVWSGAIITALLFTLGKYLIGLYINLSGVGDTYGAAGAVVIILVWVYYSTLIMLYGAHYTHVHTRERGRILIPYEHAEVVEPAPTTGTGAPPSPSAELR